MISKMTKYDFVLYAGQSEDFIEHLRELGLVDITTTGWEPQEEDRQLLTDIEARMKAKEALVAFRSSENFIESAGTTTAVFEKYTATSQSIAELRSDIARMTKIVSEWSAWGDFDVETVKNLASQGVVLRFFTTQKSTFDDNIDAWNEQYNISVINEEMGIVYFVVVTEPDAEVVLDAMEAKLPQYDARKAAAETATLEAEIAKFDTLLSQCAVSVEELDAEISAFKERLQGVKIEATASREADGLLMVMEGWAEKDTAEKVDAMLEEYPNVVYIKSDPTPEDDTPVKLKNNWFSRIFEMVGNMYALPKYGTMDLTPFFAPFYMLFFGICLNDAGYGLILLLLGLGLLAKSKEPMMKRAAWFATMCSAATVAVGLFCGSFFGMNLKEFFPEIPFFDFQNKFFSWALAIGLIQIIFGMILKVVLISKTVGFKYALASLGWLLVVASACLSAGLPMLNEAWEIPFFTASSPAFFGVLGIGVVLMLFFNSPGKNPFINLGSGLWDTYNNITGILSDVLSYIRLFAIGLSGGVLALVFNSLAAGFVPEGANIVVRILVMLPILLIGHGINLFMSTISSFVHPMRLTFVEFYKNAGFEMTMRAFEPLKKEQ
jgi:V/A-type H+-transporting ATPase subunit I